MQVVRSLADPFVGQICVLRVISGTVRHDTRLTNAATGSEERLHGLFRIRGKEHLPADSAHAGDLVAVAKLVGSPTGTLLALPGRPVAIRRRRRPRRPTRSRCARSRPPTRTGCPMP